MSDQLGQFVDLGTVQLAGAGSGNLNWKRSPQQQFDANADVQLRDFQLALPNQQPWREDYLTMQFLAKGKTNLGAETRIDAATLNVKTGSFDARLASRWQPPQRRRVAGPRADARSVAELARPAGRLAAHE